VEEQHHAEVGDLMSNMTYGLVVVVVVALGTVTTSNNANTANNNRQWQKEQNKEKVGTQWKQYNALMKSHWA